MAGSVRRGGEGPRQGAGEEPTLTYLVGPTAVGKTAVGIHLAKRLNAEILSIDARQVYKRLEIGTAKPNSRELCEVAHHLIDLYEPVEPVSAAAFAHRFQEARRDIESRGRHALAVGGSGLYVDACLGRLDAMPPANEPIRARHRKIREQEGTAALHRRLEEIDPETANRLSARDFQRISRALEVFESSGIPMSTQQLHPGPLDLRSGPPMILLLRPRQELNERIETRARAMVSRGLLDEVRRLLDEGIPPDCPAFESIGYGEFARVLGGQIPMAEAVEAFIKRTRRYAKRQVTWFRNRYRGVIEIKIPAGERAEETAWRAVAALKRLPGSRGSASLQ